MSATMTETLSRIVITNSGQSFELPDVIAGDDQKLKAALLSVYPDIENADIKRSVVDGKSVVSITRYPGTKGALSDVLAALVATPETINPVITMAMRLKELEASGHLDPKSLLLMHGDIDAARSTGDQWARHARDAFSALSDAPSVSGEDVPTGF